MNRAVKSAGQAALIAAAISGVRYAWKAFSPAIAESMPVQNTATIMQERFDALKSRLDRSGATKATEMMLEHDKKALKHAKAGEVRKWQAMRAAMVGSPMITGLGNKVGGMRSNVMAWQAKREANMAKKHKAAAMATGMEAEKRKWAAVSAWLSETGGMLKDRASGMRSMVESERVHEAGKRARNMWAEYGWGTARAEREAAKKRNNIGLGLAAGIGIGAGAAYLLARRKADQGGGYGAGQAQNMYYTGNGGSSGLYEGQRAVDQAMRQTESSFDNTTAAFGSTPARELGTSTSGSSAFSTPGTESAGIAPQDSALDRMLHGEESSEANAGQMTTGYSTGEYGTSQVSGEQNGEAWIIIPKEQWAEFIQRISDSHQGWTVRVENEGNLSLDETPVNEAHFSGMQLEPSMARPGVRMFVGKLPQEFFEHVIPDLRTVEHLPSDEEGYQGVRLTTTVDQVTIRFTDPGDATDELYKGD